MANLRYLAHQLNPRIHDAGAVLEKWRQLAHADVAVFIDGRPDDGAAMLAIPVRIVGAAAEQGDAERGAADDHPALSASAAAARPERGASTSAAAASACGVPTSIKSNSPLKAASEPAGRRSNTSRSSDGPGIAAIASSSAREMR